MLGIETLLVTISIVPTALLFGFLVLRVQGSLNLIQWLQIWSISTFVAIILKTISNFQQKRIERRLRNAEDSSDDESHDRTPSFLFWNISTFLPGFFYCFFVSSGVALCLAVMNYAIPLPKEFYRDIGLADIANDSTGMDYIEQRANETNVDEAIDPVGAFYDLVQGNLNLLIIPEAGIVVALFGVILVQFLMYCGLLVFFDFTYHKSVSGIVWVWVGPLVSGAYKSTAFFIVYGILPLFLSHTSALKNLKFMKRFVPLCLGLAASLWTLLKVPASFWIKYSFEAGPSFARQFGSSFNFNINTVANSTQLSLFHSLHHMVDSCKALVDNGSIQKLEQMQLLSFVMGKFDGSAPQPVNIPAQDLGTALNCIGLSKLIVFAMVFFLVFFLLYKFQSHLIVFATSGFGTWMARSLINSIQFHWIANVSPDLATSMTPDMKYLAFFAFSVSFQYTMMFYSSTTK